MDTSNSTSQPAPSFWTKARFWILGGLTLLIGTLFFRDDNGRYDKAVTSYYYDESAPLGQRFPLQNQEPYHFFNEYNDYFTYLLVLIFLIMLLLAYVNKERFGFMKRYAWFILFSVALGAGVLVNNVFKGLWGRPRPAHTDLWPDGGNTLGRFYMVWEPAFLDNPALIGEGVSFPSGHVSIIAAYIVLFYVFMHPALWAKLTSKNGKSNEKLFIGIKWGSLVFTIVIGIITGMGRIVAGRHHASDVLWAFGIVFLFTAFMYYVVFRIPQYETTLEKQ
jgi:membrane-associated phospholipid phosphatase